MSIDRVNIDKHVNDYGLKLIQLCKSCDFAMLNGRAGGYKGKGNSTYCGPRGESTVATQIGNIFILQGYTVYLSLSLYSLNNNVPPDTLLGLTSERYLFVYSCLFL